MHRLFVAIRPPADIRAQLLAIMGGISGARWQDGDQLHLTLRFIGKVDGRGADDLADALAGIRVAPFDIGLSGVGWFHRKGRIDTLWAGVQPREPLALLHRKVDRACVATGLPPEQRSYLPHITLARFGPASVSVDTFIALHASLACAPFTVDGFGLFESHLGHGGAHYRQIQHYPAIR